MIHNLHIECLEKGSHFKFHVNCFNSGWDVTSWIYNYPIQIYVFSAWIMKFGSKPKIQRLYENYTIWSPIYEDREALVEISILFSDPISHYKHTVTSLCNRSIYLFLSHYVLCYLNFWLIRCDVVSIVGPWFTKDPVDW